VRGCRAGSRRPCRGALSTSRTRRRCAGRHSAPPSVRPRGGGGAAGEPVPAGGPSGAAVIPGPWSTDSSSIPSPAFRAGTHPPRWAWRSRLVPSSVATSSATPSRSGCCPAAILATARRRAPTPSSAPIGWRRCSLSLSAATPSSPSVSPLPFHDHQGRAGPSGGGEGHVVHEPPGPGQTQTRAAPAAPFFCSAFFSSAAVFSRVGMTSLSRCIPAARWWARAVVGSTPIRTLVGERQVGQDPAGRPSRRRRGRPHRLVHGERGFHLLSRPPTRHRSAQETDQRANRKRRAAKAVGRPPAPTRRSTSVGARSSGRSPGSRTSGLWPRGTTSGPTSSTAPSPSPRSGSGFVHDPPDRT
jgi:hypothetical protein